MMKQLNGIPTPSGMLGSIVKSKGVEGTREVQLLLLRRTRLLSPALCLSPFSVTGPILA